MTKSSIKTVLISNLVLPFIFSIVSATVHVEFEDCFCFLPQLLIS